MNELSTFRFIFSNGEIVDKKALNIQEAAIMTVASRIQRKKTINIQTVFSKMETGGWKPIVLDSVTVNLRPRQ